MSQLVLSPPGRSHTNIMYSTKGEMIEASSWDAEKHGPEGSPPSLQGSTSLGQQPDDWDNHGMKLGDLGGVGSPMSVSWDASVADLDDGDFASIEKQAAASRTLTEIASDNDFEIRKLQHSNEEIKRMLRQLLGGGSGGSSGGVSISSSAGGAGSGGGGGGAVSTSDLATIRAILEDHKTQKEIFGDTGRESHGFSPRGPRPGKSGLLPSPRGPAALDEIKSMLRTSERKSEMLLLEIKAMMKKQPRTGIMGPAQDWETKAKADQERRAQKKAMPPQVPRVASMKSSPARGRKIKNKPAEAGGFSRGSPVRSSSSVTDPKGYNPTAALTAQSKASRDKGRAAKRLPRATRVPHSGAHSASWVKSKLLTPLSASLFAGLSFGLQALFAFATEEEMVSMRKNVGAIVRRQSGSARDRLGLKVASDSSATTVELIKGLSSRMKEVSDAQGKFRQEARRRKTGKAQMVPEAESADGPSLDESHEQLQSSVLEVLRRMTSLICGLSTAKEGESLCDEVIGLP